MNFVIVSYHFLPQSDAESFCTTRFASALVEAGHNVHVVTVQSPMMVSDWVYNALVDSRIKLHGVACRKKRRPVLARIRYSTNEWEAVDVSALIDETKKVLRGLDDPILISRTHPIVSLIVGWYCRKFAKKWVAHLSDPIPMPGMTGNTFASRLKLHWCRKWIKRALQDSDLVSVTCSGAERFFKEEYPQDTNGCSFCVTTHIGDCKLHRTLNETSTLNFEGKWLVHSGVMYPNRGGLAVAEAVEQLNKKGLKCSFIQVGSVDEAIRDRLNQYAHTFIINDTTPDVAVSFLRRADAMFSSDFEQPLPYAPQLMSKFVYQIFEDLPMVVYALKNSAMHDYSCFDARSGMFWADQKEEHSLERAIMQAFDMVKADIDRTELRKFFSSSTVISDFLNAIDSIL